MLHITFSKYDCIIMHKAYYSFTCTCVLTNYFRSHNHSHNLFAGNQYIKCKKELYVSVS